MKLKALAAGAVGAFLATAGIGYGSMTLGHASAQTDRGDVICSGNFSVDVQNPGENVYSRALAGRLTMRASQANRFRLELETRDGSMYQGFVQFNGLSPAMVMDIGPNAETLYGVGVARYDPGDCRGRMGGPAVLEGTGDRAPRPGAWLFDTENP